jgi:hypothetical protein
MFERLLKNISETWRFLLRCKRCFRKKIHPFPQQRCGDVGIFYDGRAVWEESGEWFHVKHFLCWQLPAYTQCYMMAEYFQNGFAWVQEKNGQWKIIDKNGKIVSNKPTSLIFC